MRTKLFLFTTFILLVTGSYHISAQKPNANFSVNDSIGCDILIASFTDLSTNSPTSWKWYFGDGGTSSSKNPTWGYTTPGTYTVTLIATNASGSDTIIKTNSIKVYNSPAAVISMDVSSGCVPLTVNFTDMSTIGDTAIESWQWDFGDGNYSNQQNPTNTYTTADIFYVSLRVTDYHGCSNQVVDNDSVEVHPQPTAGFSSSAQFACLPPLNVSFTNQSSPGTTSWQWNFGDGGTSASQNPSHNYNSLGYFDVSLIVSDVNNCYDTITKLDYIGISGSVTYQADFSTSTPSGCIPTVNFTDLSTLGTTTWSWNFGDGGTSTSQNPSHSYALSGNYTVTLITTNNISCADKTGDTISKVINITINTPPVIKYSIDDKSGCTTPFTVNFYDSTANIVSRLWSFGDGFFSNSVNPSHTYNFTGTYIVTLSVTDNNGCTADTTDVITISSPTPFFSGFPVEGCAPLDVAFSDQSTSDNTIVSWQWNFGDGGTSAQQDPTHTYLDSGIYNVTLTVTDNKGCSKSLTLNNYIRAGIKPVVNFSSSDSINCHPLLIDFYDNSSSLADEWHWDFGDGGTSDAENPSYSYTDTGFFDVQLIAEFYGCSDTLIKEDYIYVYPPKPIFTTDTSISCLYPFTVNFIDESIAPQTWEWDFGDGSPVNNSQNPTHIYANPGFYTVKLTVTANNPPFCKDSIVMTDYIKISDIIPGFIHDDTSICQYNSVTFTDTSYFNTFPVSWKWDFGDGTIITNGSSIWHQYDSAGVFDVRLVVTDQLGCKDSITEPGSITTYELPSPRLTATGITYGCVPLTVTFDPSQSFAIAPSTLSMWIWDFGDGTPPDTTYNSNPHSHVYNTRSYPGSFNVSLTVVDSKGCDSTLTIYNYITPTKPYPDIIYNPNVCYYNSANFWNASSGAGLSFAWDYGDGSPVDSSSDGIHLYDTTLVDTTMSFNVTLTVADSNGCDSSMTVPVTISRPIAYYTCDSTVANCPPFFVQFTDSSTLDITQWNWDFGDPESGASNNSNMQNPQHVYNIAGQYSVTLIVTNNLGCTDTLERNDILIKGPKGSFTYNPKYGCVPMEVSFISNTLGATSYLWLFGNGEDTNTVSITYTYQDQDTGTFIPILQIKDTSDCEVTIIGDIPIVVNPIPVADCYFLNGCKNTNILFTDSSQKVRDNIASWEWNFGDGSLSYNQNCIHQYTSGGIYDVTLKVTSDKGCPDSTIKQIEVYSPVADFGYNNICFYDTTLFADSSTTTDSIITGWDWNFGDGNSSTAQSPSNKYSSIGDYSVSLKITTSFGCEDSITKNITVYELPVADFSFPVICLDNPATFTNLTFDTSGFSTWQWDFGDATPVETDQDPLHAFGSVNNFNVQLIATSAHNCKDTVRKAVTVNPLPIPDFTKSDVCPGIDITFTDSSYITSGTITTWSWDFGDDSTASGNIATHRYSNSGFYDATLTLTSDKGCIDSIIKTVEIYYIPVPYFSNNTACLNETTNFTDLSTVTNSNITSWSWNFGDGNSSTAQSPSHLYFGPGDYDVTLSVVSNHSCSDDTTISIHINYLPVADFYVIDTICGNIAAVFSDSSVNPADGFINSWYWDFGDGENSDSTDPSHLYNDDGLFSVTMAVGTNTGCSDTSQRYIYVLPSPVAGFNASPQPTDILKPDISFTNTSSGATSWSWDFGDSDSSVVLNPNHTYITDGSYNVILIVSNSATGCSDTIIKTIIIKPYFTFYIPNAFTPNYDHLNDIFNGYGMSISEYHLYIFNRWGQVIFESNDQYEGWNGKAKNGNAREECQPGQYIYEFLLKDKLGKRHTFIGWVELIK